MSELDDAIARLEEAVARLDAASGEAARAPDDGHAEAGEVAAAIVGRIDAALARLEQLLEAED
jgi:hypothetical protein